MSFNSIGGSFPPSLVQLTKLHTFITVNNQFMGIPEFFLTDRSQLRRLLLSGNPLNTSLPETTYNSTTLSEFRAPSCALVGTPKSVFIITPIFSFPSNIIPPILSHPIPGTIPSQISGLIELGKLKILSLDGKRRVIMIADIFLLFSS